MYPFSLCKQLGRVILCQKQVVDRGCDFYPKPLGEFLILDTKVLDRLLVLDLLEQLCETVGIYDFLAEPGKSARLAL